MVMSKGMIAIDPAMSVHHHRGFVLGSVGSRRVEMSTGSSDAGIAVRVRLFTTRGGGRAPGAGVGHETFRSDCARERRMIYNPHQGKTGRRDCARRLESLAPADRTGLETNRGAA